MEVVTVVLGDPVVPGVGETVMSTRVQVVPFRSVSFRFVPFVLHHGSDAVPRKGFVQKPSDGTILVARIGIGSGNRGPKRNRRWG